MPSCLRAWKGGGPIWCLLGESRGLNQGLPWAGLLALRSWGSEPPVSGCRWNRSKHGSFLQVGVVGEGEEWLLIHQLANEPDARSMEVPDLNPFTYYR